MSNGRTRFVEQASSGWDLAAALSNLEAIYRKANNEQAWIQERGSIEAAIKAISNTLPTQRYSLRGILGVGGSGIVLRLADALFPSSENALKFPRPLPAKIDLVSELFRKEIRYLAGIVHPGIVRILYYKDLKDVGGYSMLPFYIMEAVSGLASGKYVRTKLTSDEEFHRLLTGAAETIAYLHGLPNGPYVHLDIKPDNLMVDSAGRPVMIDLGTCKRLDKQEDATTVAVTRSFAHPELVRQLTEDPSDDNRAKGELSRSNINPSWDLWSFGLTLLAWLGYDPHSGHVETARVAEILSPYARKYYLLLAARLLAEFLPTWLANRVGLSPGFLRSIPIADATELVELLDRVNSLSGPAARVAELGTTGSGTIQAAPGVHVAITPGLKVALEHRLFRRLNTISQLGLVSQIYPGARHTRREHSLGTYANTIRIIRALYDDPATPLFRQIISDQDCRDVLLVALFHDLGQFPLAHDLEDVDNSVFNHVEITAAMLRGVWDKKRKGHSKIVFNSLDEVFRTWRTSADRLLAILEARPGKSDAAPRLKLLRSIVSGPVDADKLDYLFRDARHLDLPYPNGVDVGRILSCLTTVVVDRVDGGFKDIPMIGIHSKGKVAAEFLSMSRYAMFSQAYWHHTVRAQKAMLLRAVEGLLVGQPSETKVHALQSEFLKFVCSLPESLYGRVNESRTLFDETEKSQANSSGGDLTGYGTDLAATDAAVLAWLEDRLNGLQASEAALIRGILTRTLFKRLWVVSRDMEERRWDSIVQIWTRLTREQRYSAAFDFERAIAERIEVQGIQDVTAMASSTAADRISRFTSGRTPWLLIDIPGDRPGSEVGLYYVLEGQRRRLRKDDRAVGELEQSPMWKEYAKNLLKAAGKVRVFCHPDLVESLESSISWKDGIEDLVGALERAS